MITAKVKFNNNLLVRHRKILGILEDYLAVVGVYELYLSSRPLWIFFLHFLTFLVIEIKFWSESEKKFKASVQWSLIALVNVLKISSSEFFTHFSISYNCETVKNLWGSRLTVKEKGNRQKFWTKFTFFKTLQKLLKYSARLRHS